MKKKFLWLVISWLMVAALVLASCGPAGQPGEQEEEEEEEEEEPAAGEPQYGGTLTMMHRITSSEPKTWDICDTQATSMYWMGPFAEKLTQGDVLGKGPRGTNESPFTLIGAEIAEGDLTGCLAESWEVTNDPPGYLYHIRPGVYWTGESVNPGVMERREYTAYDAEYHFNRFQASPVGTAKLGPYIKSYEALDKYTLQVTYDKWNCAMLWFYSYGWMANHQPREVVEAGVKDWKNQVGTGAFILEEYVPASQVTYRKNPDWWGTTTINGKEYDDIPFIDKLVYPIIPDVSTRIAALRTGKVDWAVDIHPKYEETLSSTCPDMMIEGFATAIPLSASYDAEYSPDYSQELINALMIGTDKQALIDTVLIKGVIGGWPLSSALGSSVYTQIEDLPAELQELYTYNPEKAKQMIIDIGFEGRTVPLIYSTEEEVPSEAAPLIADMWSKIGLDIELQPIDTALMLKYSQTGGYVGLRFTALAKNANKISRSLDSLRAVKQEPLYYDDYYQAEMDKIVGERDVAKRTAMLKEIAIYVIGHGGVAALAEPFMLNCWWPWIKNYYGETECGYYNYNWLHSTLWLDQDLKAEMGF
ncbi:ABC transporter substrate-binding protein [Chloroflexota bacterium]